MKATNLEEVKIWIKRNFYLSDESEEEGVLHYTDREGAGYDEPPESLVNKFVEYRKKLKAQFENVSVVLDYVDEWMLMDVKLKN